MQQEDENIIVIEIPGKNLPTITQEENNEAIRKLNATGQDEITAELLKFKGPTRKEKHLDILQKTNQVTG